MDIECKQFTGIFPELRRRQHDLDCYQMRLLQLLSICRTYLRLVDIVVEHTHAHTCRLAVLCVVPYEFSFWAAIQPACLSIQFVTSTARLSIYNFLCNLSIVSAITIALVLFTGPQLQQDGRIGLQGCEWVGWAGSDSIYEIAFKR